MKLWVDFLQLVDLRFMGVSFPLQDSDKDRIKQLNVKLFDLQNDLDSMANTMSEVEAEREEALQIAAVREEEISLLNQLAEAKDKEVDSLKQRIAELEKERDDAVFQKECLVGDKEELQLQISELQAAVAAAERSQAASPQAESAPNSSAAAEQLSSVRAQVERLQQESQDHLKRALAYADELRAAEAKLAASASSSADTQALKGRLHHAQVLLDAAEVSKEAAHRRADEADERCAAVMESLQSLAGRVEAAEAAAARVPALHAAIGELQEDLQAAGEYGAVVKRENDALRTAARALREKLHRREERVAALKSKLGYKSRKAPGVLSHGAEEF